MAKICFLVFILLVFFDFVKISKTFTIFDKKCYYEGSDEEVCDLELFDCQNYERPSRTHPYDGVFQFPLLSELSLQPQHENDTNEVTSILHLEWTAQDLGVYPNDTEKFLIRFSRSEDANNDVCFSVKPRSNYENETQRTAYFSFNISINSSLLDADGPRYVEWVSSRTNQAVTCEISYPQDVNTLYTESPELWHTVAAIAPVLMPTFTDIYLVFQTAPMLPDATYLVNVTSAVGNWYPSHHTGNNGVVVDQIRVSHNDTVYEVKVYINKEPNCTIHECLAASRRIYMPLYVPTTTAQDDTGAVTANPPTSDKNKGDSNNSNTVKIGVGVAVGGVCLAVIAGLILYFVCKQRNKSIQNHFSMQKLEGESSEPHPPSVLILYSADCPAHEQVVIELASFMREEWRIDVYLDLWDQKAILDRGWLQWMNEKLIEAQYVLIICSTGARYKFARNRQFRLKYDRAVPDMFVSAVDHVLERCYAAKQPNNGINSPECLVAYFEYAGESDIPPKLDKTKRFLLMAEICDLYQHVSKTATDKLDTSELCLSDLKYKFTRSGKQLHSVLVKAMEFFTDNPDWLAELLEPINLPESTPQKKKNGKTDNEKGKPIPDSKESPVNSSERSSSPPKDKTNTADSSSHSRMSSSATEDDALLEERQKRRRKEQEAKMQRVSSSQDTTQLVNLPSQSVTNTPTKSTLNSPPPPPKLKGLLTRTDRILQSPSTCEDIDEEQMKMDLDFIHNFDMHHSTWDHPANPSDVLIDMDFSACTPPENVPLSETYKNFMYANARSRNGSNDFVNPMFFALEGQMVMSNGIPDLKKLALVKSDKNDNVIVDFEMPLDNFGRLHQPNHCDTSTDL